MKEYIVKADFITEGDELVMPDIVGELIRCKDCKYSKPIDSEWLECQHDKRVMKATGFCSWAERRNPDV